MNPLPRLARIDEARIILRACLCPADASAAAAEAMVQAAIAQSRLIPGQLLWPWVIYDGSTLAGGCVTIESAGGSALLLLPDGITSAVGQHAALNCLRHVCAYQKSRGTRWLHTLINPAELTARDPIQSDPSMPPGLESLLQASGFIRLATLIYMERPTAPVAPPAGDDSRWRWQTYAEATHDSFVEALRRSYVDSRDCPEVAQWRTPAEALACHRHSGLFDPRRWLIALDANGPAGCVLLNEVPLRDSLEVTYMGAAAHARGRGLGSALLSRAVWIASRAGFASLCLVVDERNAPARRLYQSRGFAAVATRTAWMSVLFDSDER